MGSGGGHGDLHDGAEFLDLFGRARDLVFAAVPSRYPAGAEVLIRDFSADDVGYSEK